MKTSSYTTQIQFLTIARINYGEQERGVTSKLSELLDLAMEVTDRRKKNWKKIQSRMMRLRKTEKMYKNLKLSKLKILPEIASHQ